MKALQFNMNLPRAAMLMALGKIRHELFYKGKLATVSLIDAPEPDLPGPEWVKLKTSACGFCGSDLNLIFLRKSMTASPFSSFPCIIGHEFCGYVTESGEDAGDIKKDDFITVAPHLSCVTRNIEPICEACKNGFVNSCENYAEGSLAPGMFTGICKDIGGGFAPYVVAHKSQVFKLPKNISPETGSMIEPFSVALTAVLDNMPDDNDRVLIVGGGVIGRVVLSAIKALDINCEITVAEPSPYHAELCRNAGADNLIKDGDIIKNAPLITKAKSYKPIMGKNILMGGFTKIYDTVGNSQTLNASLRCLAAGGVLSVVGISESVKLDMTALWLKNQVMRGMLAYGYRDKKWGNRHVYDIAIELVKKGKVNLDEMITHRFAIDDYIDMIEVNLAKGKNKAVKTVVVFD